MYCKSLNRILSIDAGLELTPDPYHHFQVKDWNEATTVTCGCMLHLLIAGRKSYDAKVISNSMSVVRNSMSVELVGVLTVERELLSDIWHPVLVSHRRLQSHWVWQ